MGDNSENDRQDRELGPSYKSLFLGACVIIGGAFGWWLTNFVSAFERLQKDHTKLETRVAELEWYHRHEHGYGKVGGVDTDQFSRRP